MPPITPSPMPSGPDSPAGPGGPALPGGPSGPRSPGGPDGPSGPGGPSGPRGPSGPCASGGQLHGAAAGTFFRLTFFTFFFAGLGAGSGHLQLCCVTGGDGRGASWASTGLDARSRKQ